MVMQMCINNLDSTLTSDAGFELKMHVLGGSLPPSHCNPIQPERKAVEDGCSCNVHSAMEEPAGFELKMHVSGGLLQPRHCQESRVSQTKKKRRKGKNKDFSQRIAFPLGPRQTL